jgi:hypothetical protein
MVTGSITAFGTGMAVPLVGTIFLPQVAARASYRPEQKKFAPQLVGPMRPPLSPMPRASPGCTYSITSMKKHSVISCQSTWFLN